MSPLPAAALLACASGAGPWRRFSPADSDPEMRPPAYSNGDSVAQAPDGGAGSGLLTVFLAGTGMAAGSSMGLLSSSLAAGHHTLALSYQYAQLSVAASADWCNRNRPGDCGCQERLHREVVLGGDGRVSGMVNVSARSSVVGRLAAALRYLNATAPTESWGRFLADASSGPAPGAVRWGTVLLAGHSQGAGHVLYLAKQVAAVRRVALFSGPEDRNASCSWQGRPPWLTPPAGGRMRGLAHRGEGALDFIQDNWAAAGWPSASWADAGDGGAVLPAWRGANALLTRVAPAAPGVNADHLSTCVDGFTPLGASGSPLYAAAVWPWLLSDGL